MVTKKKKKIQETFLNINLQENKKYLRNVKKIKYKVLAKATNFGG